MKACRSRSAKEFATGLVRGNPVGAELVERGVDPNEVINAVATQLAKRFGAAPLESTMRAIVWRAVKP
jgi:hypothetical protein